MEIKIDKPVLDILNILKNYGKVYIIGGYIRDKLLGEDTYDVDVAVNIPQNQLLEILKEFDPSVYNSKYEILRLKYQGFRFEIARFREESGVFDGRNPVSFNFVDDIEKDIYRRDYTINALVYDGKNIIDYNNQSKRDLKDRIIRAIGDTKTRLIEDKVRILRAFRFVAKLGFDLDYSLEKEIAKLSKNNNIFYNFSKERMISEFNKIIFYKYSHKALLKMYDLNILKFFIPEYDNTKFDRNIFLRICTMYHCMIDKYKVFDYELAYSLIFAFSAKKKNDAITKGYEVDSMHIYDDFTKRFLIKNKKTHTINNLIYYHNIIYKNPSLIMLKRMLLDLVNNKGVCRLINLTKIMYQLEFESESINTILYNIQRLYMAKEPVFLSDLELLNVDLYNLGLDNKKFLTMKMEAFKDVLDGKISNSKDAIIKSIFSKYDIDINLEEEKCAGAIVYRKKDNNYQFLIIKGANEGSWGFPKGHIEDDENEVQTAVREVKEETNIDINIINSKGFRYCIKYIIKPNIYKEVDLFLAKSYSDNIQIDKKELDEAHWMNFEEAVKKLTFSYQREILRKAMLYIYD